MIYDKLAKFKALNVTITRDGINPHFKNRYSTLDEVLTKIEKPLAELSVLVLQTPTKEGLETRLIDTEDKTEVVSLVPYTGVSDMQKLGGAITYARRYALISMLGLSDDDDDGNTASKGVQGQTKEPFTEPTKGDFAI